jgi:hypothetical protein
VVGRYLERLGLSRSLARTITPTLSALGMSAGGVFSRQALEIGRLIHEGRRREALSALREAALRNCVVRDVVERLGDGCEGLAEAVDAVLRGLRQTAQARRGQIHGGLVRAIHPPCTPCSLSCVDRASLASCAGALVERGHIRRRRSLREAGHIGPAHAPRAGQDGRGPLRSGRDGIPTS